jgi:hypothetical protein
MKTRILVLGLAIALIALSGCNQPIDEATLSTVVAGTLEALDAGDKALPDTPAETGVDPAALIPTEVAPDPGPGVLTIAYINAGLVWFVQEGGTPVQLTTSGNAEQVVLSTDGQLAAFVRHELSPELYELRVVATATGVETVLVSQADFDAFYPLDGALHHAPFQLEFIPGTHTLLMNTREIFEGPGLLQNNELWSIDADSGSRTLLLDRGLGGDFYISPSGGQLALVLPTSIGFANIDGTGRSPDHLTFAFIITYSEYAYYPTPVWALDGSAVVVVIPPADPFASNIAQVWRVPVSGSAVSLLNLTGFNFFRNQRRTPLLAPDLSKVAFMREMAPNTFDLVVVPLDGSPESVYTSGDISWQAWNPDSARFVYSDTPRNYLLGGLGLPATGVGFGAYLRWVDVDTFLYLDQLTATHRFGLVNLPGPASELAVISGNVFDFDFTD